jgi:hypothetical protein
MKNKRNSNGGADEMIHGKEIETPYGIFRITLF